MASKRNYLYFCRIISEIIFSDSDVEDGDNGATANAKPTAEKQKVYGKRQSSAANASASKDADDRYVFPSVNILSIYFIYYEHQV